MPNSPKDASGPQAQPTVGGKPQGPQTLPEEVVCDELDGPHAPGSSYCRHPRPALGTCSNFWHPDNGRDVHARRAAVGDLTAAHADHVNDSGCLNWKRASATPPQGSHDPNPRPAHPPDSPEGTPSATPEPEKLGEKVKARDEMILHLVQWIEGEGSIVPRMLVAAAKKLATERAAPTTKVGGG